MPSRLVGAIRTMPGFLRLVRRGLEAVVGTTPRTAAAYIALVALLAILPVTQVWFSKLVVDELTPGRGGSVGVALALAAGYALTLVVPATLSPLRRSLAAWIEDRAVAEVDRRLMDAGGRLADLVRMERPAFQDEVRTVQENI